jgi:mannose-6-phosphate isomerase-like protein (cupin superfamily)
LTTKRELTIASGSLFDLSTVERGERPWGNYVVLSDQSSHKVKRITVEPGHRLSYQRHRNRSEHWFVVAGSGIATIDGHERPVQPGAAIDIPRCAAHRIASSGPVPLVFIEVQNGEDFSEHDIERLEDDYGRDVR